MSSVVQHLFCTYAAAVAMLCHVIIAALHPVLHPHSGNSGFLQRAKSVFRGSRLEKVTPGDD
jgi:hypothetical protein